MNMGINRLARHELEEHEIAFAVRSIIQLNTGSKLSAGEFDKLTDALVIAIKEHQTEMIFTGGERARAEMRKALGVA